MDRSASRDLVSIQTADESNSRREWVAIALPVIAAITTIVAIAYRFGQGLTVDEPFTANTARLPWRELWHALPIDNIPFWYLLVKVWTGLFGESEIALRSLSAIAYGGAVWLTGAAARKTAGTAAAIVAALLVAASDRVGLEHAATARPYALLACITAAGLLQSLRLLQTATPSRRRVTALATTHVIGMLTHPTYAVIATASAASTLLTKRRLWSAPFVAACVALLAYFVLWGPLLAETMALRTTSWMRAPSVGGVQRAYMLIWGVGPGFIMVGALLVAVFASLPRTRLEMADPVVAWVVWAAGFAWILVIGVSLWQPIFEPTRTPVMLVTVTSLAIATILVRLGGAAPAWSSRLSASAPRDSAWPHGQATTRTRRARAYRTCDTLVAPGLASWPVTYYFRRLNAPSCLGTAAFPRDFTDWVGRLQDPVRFGHLQAEAEQTADAVAAHGKSIWLLRLNRGEMVEASDLMEAALRRHATCHAQEPLRGAFFDTVVRCERPDASR